MEILKSLEKVSEMNKSLREKQRTINVSEVYHLWNHLMQRYNVMYITNLLNSSVQDTDFKLVINHGSKILMKHIEALEKELLNYGIPLPLRPPKQVQETSSSELISDRYIYRRILSGIQAFLPVHNMAFIHSTSPKIRDLFMSFMNEEMKVYDKFLEYGKMKDYLIKPPMYRP
ncbi:Protein of unknown function (DUF3231) [Desulfosporosinus acidiphilus SJ4]|uniref:DUF3231 family protein n=1 Tax=Desulfosporosinus acidiphilus (strain DSM 22704 / JCM 16185 / SJ4) TaxID=646529 RepID=I4D6K1_DESAJ|nr:DUF3231 family protein [Desulfosporosinus acidiphilus]AFM41425.1 Protein of unknown function (DUF3231) [Desulfosporosinus acidiphilus SJ4]